ncbi:MAG: hypothetical protein JOY71_07005 [Acetobacteraceae bacterium]|nr:hypothetical protein [Acetobacteraceae bacterium]
MKDLSCVEDERFCVSMEVVLAETAAWLLHYREPFAYALRGRGEVGSVQVLSRIEKGWDDVPACLSVRRQPPLANLVRLRGRAPFGLHYGSCDERDRRLEVNLIIPQSV